jgi:hypothetical protein
MAKNIAVPKAANLNVRKTIGTQSIVKALMWTSSAPHDLTLGKRMLVVV